MAKLSILAGATSQSVNVFIQDSSATTGVGLSGLAFNTSSLIAYFTFTGANAAATAITLATLAAVNSAYSSGGFKEIDATNMKGLYRLDIPNAALATSKGRSVTIQLGGATNMAPCVLEVELTGWDNQDSVHGGLTCLPNTAVTTNASLLTSGAGTDQLSVTTGRIDIGKALGTAVTLDSNNVLNVSAKYLAGTALTGRDIGASVLLSAGTGTGQLDFTSGVTKANATQWLGGTIPAVNVTGVPLVDAKYLLGTIFATPATAGIPDINIKNINNVVAATPGAAGGLFIAGTNAATTITTGLTTTFTGNLTGSVASVTGAVGSVTGAVGSVTGNVGGNVVGSTASVTARVTANTDQWNGTTVNGTVPPDTVFIRSAQAQSGGANTITLDASASATNNLYSGETIFIRSGAGAGQSAVITGYVGATKVATVSPAWATTPDSSSNFSILAMGPSATTVSGTVNANVIQWNSSNVVAPNVAGVPLVDLKYTLGTISPAAAGSVAIDWAQVSNKTSTVNLSGTTVGTVTSSTVTTNNDKTGYSLTQTFPSNFSSLAISAGGAAKVDGTSALTESYAAQGAALTLAQGLYGINQFLGQHSTSGTTWTVKKRDASTTAKTFTLDSATAPTSITEAT